MLAVVTTVMVMLTRREHGVDQRDRERDRIRRLAAHRGLVLELGTEVDELSDRCRGLVRHIAVDAEHDASVKRDCVHRVDVAGDVREPRDHVGEHLAGATQEAGRSERRHHGLLLPVDRDRLGCRSGGGAAAVPVVMAVPSVGVGRRGEDRHGEEEGKNEGETNEETVHGADSVVW